MIQKNVKSPINSSGKTPVKLETMVDLMGRTTRILEITVLLWISPEAFEAIFSAALRRARGSLRALQLNTTSAPVSRKIDKIYMLTGGNLVLP